MSTSAVGLTPSQVNSAEPVQWRQAIRQALDDTRCASPGFMVEDLDVDAQTVTVQLAVQERVRPANGKAQWWDVPPIVNVPIIIPRGGGYSITLPLKKGTEGMLIFCDTCFDNWWVNGQTAAPRAHNTSAPSGSQRQLEVRRHYVHDCGFLPGMYSQPNVLSNYAADTLQIRSDDGATVIDVSSMSGVTITAPAASVANGGTALALMTQAWQTWFTTYVLPHISTGTIPTQPTATSILKGQ